MVDRPHAAARHRALEGFVLRLARRADADAFALRGGMLVRQWFPTVGRPALDLDLACDLVFDPEALRARYAEVLADNTVADGVRFHPTRFRIRPIWTDTAAPGLRTTALAKVGPRTLEIRIDTTFGLTLLPAPVHAAFVTPHGTAWLRMCHPATLVGRKLQVIALRGPAEWRPKDLDDVRRVLEAGPLDADALARAIDAAADPEGPGSRDGVRDALVHRSFWTHPSADVRWASEGTETPLAAAIAAVRAHLRPLFPLDQAIPEFTR